MKSSSCEDCVKSDCKQHKKKIQNTKKKLQNINIYYCMLLRSLLEYDCLLLEVAIN